MNPEYRIRRRRKPRPGDAASVPTGPLRWRLEQRVAATGIAGIFSQWEWRVIRYRTTHEGAIAAMNAHIRSTAARTLPATPLALPAKEQKPDHRNRISAGAHLDERALWTLVTTGGLTPREAGRALDMPTKRVAYLCGKWARNGIYDYGVTIDLGQPTAPPTTWDNRAPART